MTLTVTSEERIAELEATLEAERAYTSMRDMSYDADVERGIGDQIKQAEERAFQRAMMENGDSHATMKEFTAHAEQYLNDHIPQMLEEAIPEEYRGQNFHKALRPNVKVTQYTRPETMETIRELVLEFPQRRVMLLNSTVRDEIFRI